MKNSKLNRRLPRCPAGLSEESRGWWHRVLEEWQLSDADLLTLENALRSLDLLRKAEAAVAEQGLTITDRFGQVKQNPNLLTARDAKNALLKHWQALDLESTEDGYQPPPWARSN